MNRYKARLVVKGFTQKEGIYFTETFSPIIKMSSIIIILGLTASLDLVCEKLDVKTTFLHGELEKIFIWSNLMVSKKKVRKIWFVG